MPDEAETLPPFLPDRVPTSGHDLRTPPTCAAAPLEKLAEAIKALHGCDSRHMETTRVTAVRKDKSLFAANVATFLLLCHPTAAEAFAWAYQDKQGIHYISILAVPPVHTPADAVREAVKSGILP